MSASCHQGLGEEIKREGSHLPDLSLFFFLYPRGFLPYLNPIAPVHFKARFLCVAKCSVYVTRIVLLSHMSGVYWRRTSKQDGVGSARDGEPVLQNRYMLQVKVYYTIHKTQFKLCSDP